MSQPLTHARIGYDSITTRGTVDASSEITGFPAVAAQNQLTYSFWSAGLPSTWEIALDEAESCNYFGVAAHDLHSNHVVAAMQAFIDGAWATLPSLVTFGDVWRFAGDLYGERGAAPGATIGSLKRGVAVDGQPILTNGVQDSKFGRNALTVEPATTNIFPENVRTGGDTNGDTTGFSGIAAYNTARKVSGDGCILSDNAPFATSITTNYVTVVGSTDYTISLKYLVTEAVPSILFTVRRTVGGASGTTVYAPTPGVWHTIQLHFTTVPADYDAQVSVDTVSGPTYTSGIYVDEFQLEANTYATTWVNGSRAAGDLIYQPEILQQLGGSATFNIWFRFGSLNARNRFLIDAQGPSADEAITIWGSTSHFLNLTLRKDGYNYVKSAAFTEDDEWHMLTAVIDSGNDPAASIYIDGRLITSTSDDNTPNFAEMNIFAIGRDAYTASYDVGSDGESCIGEVTILNKALTLDEIRAWYDGDEPADEGALGLPSHDDDRPIMRLVEETRSNLFRLRFAGQTTPVVGVIYMGSALEMERPLYGGHTPINLARSTVIRPNTSVGGQFLGRSIIRAGSKGSWSWSNLTAGWVRKYLDQFISQARLTPFFMLWRPNKFPGEAGYCWTQGDQAPVNAGVTDKMTFALEAEGLGVE